MRARFGCDTVRLGADPRFWVGVAWCALVLWVLLVVGGCGGCGWAFRWFGLMGCTMDAAWTLE